MKREMCPFCGHRWIRCSREATIIECPNCHNTYDPTELLKEFE